MKWLKSPLAVLAAAALTALLFTGCTIKQQVQLETDGSGSVSMSIRLEKVFTEYINDLAELTGQSLEGQIFNVEEIKKGFAERSDVQLTRVSTPSPDALDMSLSFRSIEKVFSSEQKLQESGIVRFARVADGYSVRFRLDRSNFGSLLKFMPVLQNPLFEGLGPQENDDTTEKEYLELMELALGEGGAKSVQNSYIETRVVVKGKIVSQTGGTVSAGAVVYRIPLIRLLLLDQPLDYSLTFK